MTDYSAAVVLAIIAHEEEIESFLESTTASLNPSQYSSPSLAREQTKFLQQEGHTLWNMGSATHVPSKASFRENLMIMRSDVTSARFATLTDDEDEALRALANRKAGRLSARKTALGDDALKKVLEYLNDGTL